MPGPEDQEFRVVGPDGEVRVVVGVKALGALGPDWRIESAEEGAKRASAQGERDRYTGTLNAIKAGGQAVLRGATIGGSDVLQRLVGGEAAAEELSGLRAAQPDLSTGLEIGTGVALGIGALGKGAVGTITRGTPTGFTSGQAARIAGTGAGRITATLPRAVAAGAFEGTVQNFGMNLGAVARGDLDATAESLVIDPIKYGGGGGGLLGGVLHGGERGVGAIRKKIRASDMFNATPEAVDAATKEAQQAVQGGLSVADATTDAAIAELAAARAQHLELDMRLRQGLTARRAEAQAIAQAEAAPVGAWDGADTVKHVDNEAAMNAARDRAVEARAARAGKRKEAVPEAVDAAGDATVRGEAPTFAEAAAPAERKIHPRDVAAPRKRIDPDVEATRKLTAAEQTTATGAKIEVTEHELTFSDQAFNDNIDALHAAGVTPETLHVPDPVTGVTPFHREMARLDPKAAALVTALEEVAAASQKVRERWTVYGKHLKDDIGRRRSGPPLRLNLDELVEESIGRQKAAFKDSNDRERLEILRALGPEKGRQLLYSLTDAERKAAFKSLGEARAAQLLEGVPQIKYNLFQKERGGFGGAWEVPPAPAARTFAEQVKEVASRVDPGMRRGQLKVFLSDIRRDPAFAAMSDAEWADALFEARKKGELTLGRIDMAGDDLARVEASAIRPKGADAAAVQHYVEVPPAAVPVADDVVQAAERWAQPDWLDDALSLSPAKAGDDVPVALARERSARGSGPHPQAPEELIDYAYGPRGNVGTADDWTPAEVDNMTSFQEGVESISSLERSVKNLTEALGDRAPAEAQAFVQQINDALADQERRSMRASVHALEADAVPPEVIDQEALAGGWPGASPRRGPRDPYVAPPSPVLAERLRAQGWDVMSPIDVPPPESVMGPALYKNPDEYEAAIRAEFGPRVGPPKVGLPRNMAARERYLAEYRAKHGPYAGEQAKVVSKEALAGTMPGKASARLSDTLTGGLRAGDATLPGMAGDVLGAPPAMPGARRRRNVVFEPGDVGDAGEYPFDPFAPGRSVPPRRDVPADDPFFPTYRSGQRPGYAGEAQDAATLASRASRPAPAAAGRGAPAKQGGLLSTLADAGAVLEAVQAVGVATPLDPDKIPLVGPILGAYLKFRALGMAGRKLGFRVPWTRGNAVRARGQAVRSRMLKAVDGVLAVGQKALKAGAVVAGSQSWRMKDVLDRGLDGAEVERRRRRTLRTEAELVKEHARVWRERAANPEIVRAQVLRQLTVDLDGDGRPDPLDPDLVERTVEVAQRKAEYLAKHTPVEPPPNLLYPSRWEPSFGEQVRFTRRLRAVNDPETVYQDIRDGTLTPEAAEAFREVYPALYDDTRNALLARAAQGGLVLPPSHVASLSILFKVALRPTLDAEIIQRLQEAGLPPHPTGVPGGAALAAPPGGAPDLASASTVGPYRPPS
jgi:hypothetical protein